MDYYERRRRATQMIDNLYSDGVSTKSIIYKVSLIYGFGKKFVEDRINIIEEILEENGKN